MPTPSHSTCNLFTPCKGALTLFRQPVSLRAFKFRNLHRVVEKMSPRRRRRRNFRSVRAVFWPLMSMRSEEMDKIGELPSLAEPDRVIAPFSSPVTPAYMKMVRLRREESGLEVHDEIEEACRSFESYLMEMLVEERKVRDLMDVEELLNCWDNLKCPVFVELVCKFYGEICKDLFSGDGGGINEVVDESVGSKLEEL